MKSKCFIFLWLLYRFSYSAWNFFCWKWDVLKLTLVTSLSQLSILYKNVNFASLGNYLFSFLSKSVVLSVEDHLPALLDIASFSVSSLLDSFTWIWIRGFHGRTRIKLTLIKTICTWVLFHEFFILDIFLFRPILGLISRPIPAFIFSVLV